MFEITFAQGDVEPLNYSEILEAFNTLAINLLYEPGYNTGKYSRRAVQNFLALLQDAEKYENASEVTQQTVAADLRKAYKELKKTGRNPMALPREGEGENVTSEYLVESNRFTTSEKGNRFGTPKYWTVENCKIPVFGNGGIKNGIDSYPGYNTLALGVWAGEDVTPYTCDLRNAVIYRKVHLQPGKYFFGAKFEEIYNIGQGAYIYAAEEVLPTAQIESKSIAFIPIRDCQKGSMGGIEFALNRELDVVLAFAADLTTNTQQEFRIADVEMLSYGLVNQDALAALVQQAEDLLKEARVSSNTGFYSQTAVAQLRSAVSMAKALLQDAGTADYAEAVNDLQNAIQDFLEKGKNQGGAPSGTGQDITVSVLHERDNFKRTDNTLSSGRYGAPKYWTVENFGFDSEAGIDNISGSDCLALQVWWNNQAYADKGYDMENVRVYQEVTLPAGRYYLGATYTGEPNEDMYIFASRGLLHTSEIPTQSIAYEQVKKAPNDGSFRGIFFSLPEETRVCLGWQTDFSQCVTNNLRVSAIRLISYGELDYQNLQEMIKSVEKALQESKVNENTGSYSQYACDKLQNAIAEAKSVEADADYNTLEAAYNALNAALADFHTNGKNHAGQPVAYGAEDITLAKLVESSDFSRANSNVSSRFASPKYWTVENYNVPTGGSEGVRGGLDNYPGFECLTLGIWDDKHRSAAGEDLTNARLYRRVHLGAGTYYFGGNYQVINRVMDTYMFVATETMNTPDIPQQSIAYAPVSECRADGKFWGLNFTLYKAQDVLLGWQDDVLNGANEHEFRVRDVVLYQYGGTLDDGIESLQPTDNHQPAAVYNLQGMRLSRIPSRGVYVVSQGGRATKYLAK